MRVTALSPWLSLCLLLCLSLRPSLWLSLCLSPWLPLCPSLLLSQCLSLCFVAVPVAMPCHCACHSALLLCLSLCFVTVPVAMPVNVIVAVAVTVPVTMAVTVPATPDCCEEVLMSLIDMCCHIHASFPSLLTPQPGSLTLWVLALQVSGIESGWREVRLVHLIVAVTVPATAPVTVTVTVPHSLDVGVTSSRSRTWRTRMSVQKNY